MSIGVWSKHYGPGDGPGRAKYVPSPDRTPRLVRVRWLVRHHPLAGDRREIVIFCTDDAGAERARHDVLARSVPDWARIILASAAEAGAEVLLSWEGSAGRFAFWGLPLGVRNASEWEAATQAALLRREQARQSHRRAQAEAWAANINVALAQAAGPGGLWEGVSPDWLLSQSDLWGGYGPQVPDSRTVGTAVSPDGTTYTVVLSRSLLRPDGRPHWRAQDMVRRVGG